MTLMDGQLSHIGLDARCRLLSAFLADDEAGDEDIDQTGDLEQNNTRGAG